MKRRIQIEDDLAVEIHAHDAHDGPAREPMWSLVTEGLTAHGQREVVLTVARTLEAKDGSPKGMLGYIPMLKRFAREGRAIDAGGISGYRAPGPLQFGAFVHRASVRFSAYAATHRQAGPYRVW